MDRHFASRCWPVLASLLLLTAATAVGCRSMAQTMAYLVNGTNMEAEYEGLEGKKVAVVCRALSGQEFRNAGAAKALAQQVSDLLKLHVKKIHIIDPQTVATLIDEKNLEEYSEIGKALKADMVVGIELDSFSVLDGQTLYRGRASCSIKAYNVAEKHIDWKKTMPQSVYPTTGGIATSDRTEGDFRDEFTRWLADQVARNFFAHDKYDDFGRDAVGF